MKILFISNTDGALYIFRKQLLNRLLGEEHNVSAITSEGKYVARLTEMGVSALTLNFAGTSASLLDNWKLLLNLRKLVFTEKPDIVHNFTHKPAIFGTIAARLSGVDKIFISITGLGKLFTGNSLKTRVLRFLLLAQYKIVLKFATGVFFLNIDDLNYFVTNKLLAENKAIFMNGEGVDLQEVTVPLVEETSKQKKMLGEEIGVDLTDKVVVVFNARALKEKGVNEFYEAASCIQKSSERYVFIHLGLLDPESAPPFTEDTIKSHARKCGVFYLGFKDNIQDYMTACDVAVLPSSYREGVPRSLIEALALDKYIITTDTPGCRETMIDKWNGNFCMAGDAHDLASKLVPIDRVFLQNHTGRSRDLCERKFDVEKQIDLILNCYFTSRAANG